MTAGWETVWGYLIDFLPQLSANGQPALAHSNQTIYGFGLRLFAEVPYVASFHPSPLLLFGTQLSLAYRQNPPRIAIRARALRRQPEARHT